MNRKQRKLARRIQRQARRANVTQEEWLAIMDVCTSPEKLEWLQLHIDKMRMNPWQGPDQLMSMDWKDVFANLWDWVSANWKEILKFILAIAPLLLEPQHEDS